MGQDMSYLRGKADMKDLIIELLPSVADNIDISKALIERNNNAIIITFSGFTEPADINIAYVTSDHGSEGSSP